MIQLLKKRKLNKKGFTLAELLVAVGIMIILMGIGFVAVTEYQKSLKLTENDSIARQIFVAAQNHITEAKASGEWDKYNSESGKGEKMTYEPSDYPYNWNDDSTSADHDFRYITFDPADTSSLNNTILKLILPFGSIDDYVRSGHSYVIEYDYKTASVYGVFYTDSKATVKAEQVSYIDEKAARGSSSEAKSIRKNYSVDNVKDIIGYYGGATADSLANVKLDNIELTVDNSDELTVNIVDRNYYKTADDGTQYKTRITLLVTGEESGKSKTLSLELNSDGTNKAGSLYSSLWTVKTVTEGTDRHLEYAVTLDSITSADKHFANIFGADGLIPGENITITAYCTSNEVICRTTMASGYTNSLFEANHKSSEVSSAVTVNNIRHLENLSPEISNIPTIESVNNKRVVKTAEVTADIAWDASVYPAVYKSDKSSVDSYISIANEALQGIEGNNHVISNLVMAADKNGNAGLIGTVGNGESSKQTFDMTNVFLVDATVTGSKSVGTLIGYAMNGTVSGCGVYLSSEANYEIGGLTTTPTIQNEKYRILNTSNTGAAGGLVGSATGALIIKDSYAAVPVKANGGIVGGLVGEFTGVNFITGESVGIANSYVGGFTQGGKFDDDYKNIINKDITNGIAGGLIGLVDTQVNNLVVNNCYSTASVEGGIDGGLFGENNGTAIICENSYYVGKVYAHISSGFIAGSADNISFVDVKYMTGISNGVSNGVGNNASIAGISGGNYNDMSVKTNSKDTIGTHSYDSVYTSEDYYPFRTVNNTSANVVDGTIGTHYGDWCKNLELKAEIVYYEIYEDGTNHYIGLYNDTLNINSLSDNFDIVQDGYASLSTLADVQKAEVLYGDSKNQSFNNHLVSESIYTDIKPLDTDVIKWTGLTDNSLNDDTTLVVDGLDDIYYLQFLDLNIVNSAGNTRGYLNVVKLGDSIQISVNMHYAKSEIVKGEQVSKIKDLSKVYIRTERQYSMMTQDLKTVSGNVFNQLCKAQYIQEMDLNFGAVTGSNECTYTSDYFGCNTLESLGSDWSVPSLKPVVAAANTVANCDGDNAVGFGGKYDGENHTIEGLSLIGEAGYSAGMFGNIMGAPSGEGSNKDFGLLTNIKLTKLEVVSSSGYVGGLVGYATLANGASFNATVSNVEISGANIVGGKAVGGLVGKADSMQVNPDGGDVKLNNISVTGDYMLGGVFGVIYNIGSSFELTAQVYQNITSNNITVKSSGNYDTGLVDSGFGGFAGRIRASYGDVVQLKFNNIKLNRTTVNLSKNDNNSGYCFGSLWVGTLDNRLRSGARNEIKSVSFNDCEVIDSTLNGYRLSNADNINNGKAASSYGGIYGGVLADSTMSGKYIDIQRVTFTGSSINVNTQDGTRKSNVGRLIGAVYSVDGSGKNTVNNNKYSKIFFSSKLDTYSMPNVSCITSTAENLGGYIGLMYSSTFRIEEAMLNLGAVTFDSNVLATNRGGFVGGMIYSTFGSDTYTVNVDSVNMLKANNATAETRVGGLFGYVDSKSSINNLNISGNITITTTAKYEGGVIGRLDGIADKIVVGTSAATTNTKPSGSVSLNNPGYVAGGIAGQINGGTIKNSIIRNVTVSQNGSGNGYTGGIVGQMVKNGNNSSAANNCSASDISITNGGKYVGGFAGSIETNGVANCDVRLTSITNNESINDTGEYIISSDTSNAYVGGFAGRIYSSSTSVVYSVNNCFSAIPVTAKGNNSSSGGFIGQIYNGEVHSSYASGDVLSGDISGGFVGLIGGLINEKECKGTNNINNCYATGDVSGNGTIGGFAGTLYKSVRLYINNCYSLGIVNQESTVHGGFIGKTDGYALYEEEGLSELKTQKVFDLIRMDLIEAYNNTNNSDEMREACAYAIKVIYKRINTNAAKNPDIDTAIQGLKNNNFKSMYAYLKAKASYAIDSGAASVDFDKDLENNTSPAFALVIAKFLTIDEYSDIAEKVNTWQIPQIKNDVLSFIYAVGNIDADYKAGRITAGATTYGYMYTENSGTLKKEKVDIVMKEKSDGTYGKYLQVGSVTVRPETSDSTSMYTGCVYLSDSRYNDCDSWADKDLVYVHPKTFDEMTASDKDSYFKQLNTNVKSADDGEGYIYEEVQRFVMTEQVSDYATHRYDKTLGLNYPYPALINADGIGNDNPIEGIPNGRSYWGDWPEKPAYDVGLVYYEVVDGQVYYHGYASTMDADQSKVEYEEIKTDGEGLTNGLVTENDKYVTEDGYVLAIKDDGNLDMKVIKCGGSWIRLNNLTESKTVSIEGMKVYYLESDESENWKWTNDRSLFQSGYGCIEVGESEESWDWSGLVKSTQFSFTPYFANTVLCGNDVSNKQYFIRSARQLENANYNSGWAYFGNASNTFVQELDIDYSTDTKFTSNSQDINITHSKIKSCAATFVNKTYKDNNNNTVGFIINGISDTLIESNTGSIYGIVVTDINIVDGGTRSTLVQYNSGVIDSCIVRGKNLTYTSNIINTSGEIAGLVEENNGSGLIKNSAFIGTITAKNAYGFVSKNTGRITDCYVNAIITGSNSACGFVNNNSGGGIIENCHVVGEISSTNDSIAGFADTDGGTITNCYNALWKYKINSSSAKNVYTFVKNDNGGQYDGNYYISDAQIEALNGSNYSVVGLKADMISYYDAKNKAESSGNLATKETTNKYGIYNDLSEDVYPFELISDNEFITMQHYGDWMGIPYYYGFAYYEDYSGLSGVTGTDGKTYGVYAGLAGLGGSMSEYIYNSLANTHGTSAIPDGNTMYGMLVPKGSTIGNNNSTYNQDNGSQNIKNVLINEKEYEFYPLKNQGNSSHSVTQTAPAFSFTYKEMKGNKTFYYNSDFAASISTNQAILGKESRPFQVRTNAQLRNITTSNANYISGNNNLYYLQTYDVTLSNANFAIIGSYSYRFAQIYDGYGYSVKNITQTNSSAESRGTVGMFGWVSGTLKGIVIDNATMTASAGSNRKYLGILAGQVSGTVDSCSVINSSLNVTGGAKDQYIGGLIGETQAATVQNSKITDSSVTVNYGATDYEYIGGFIGHVNVGSASLITDCSTESINVSAPGNNDTTQSAMGGFIGKIDTSGGTLTVTGCNANKTSVKYTSKGVYLGGFVGYVGCKTSFSNCNVSGDEATKTVVSLTNSTASGAIGGFAGYSNGAANSTYENCNVKYIIVDNMTSTGNYTAAGGFIGKNNSMSTFGATKNDGTSDLEKACSVIDSRVIGGQGTYYLGGFVGQESAGSKYYGCNVFDNTVNSWIDTEAADKVSVTSDNATITTGNNNSAMVGGFIGELSTNNSALIQQCGAIVSVANTSPSSNNNRTENVGGFIGRQSLSTYNNVIIECYSKLAVGNLKANYVGGFAGYEYGYSKFTDCYALYDNSGTSNNIYYQAAFVGQINGTYERNINCFGAYVSDGKLKSDATIGFYRTTGGQIAGSNLKNCFLYSGTETDLSSNGTIYLRYTPNFNNAGTFTALGWDFTNIWQITNGKYPTLKRAAYPVTNTAKLSSNTVALAGYTSQSGYAVIDTAYILNMYAKLDNDASLMRNNLMYASIFNGVYTKFSKFALLANNT